MDLGRGKGRRLIRESFLPSRVVSPPRSDFFFFSLPLLFSDGETVESYHSDPEEPEPEPEQEVLVVDDAGEEQVSHHLEDVPSFLYPHLPTDEGEEEEDDPEPLIPLAPSTFQQLSANRIESPTKLSLPTSKTFSELTSEGTRIKWEPNDDDMVPYLSEFHQHNHLFPSSPLASTSNSLALFPLTSTPSSSLPNPDAPLPSLLYSSGEQGSYSPQSTNLTTPDQRMEDINDGKEEAASSSSFREGSVAPLPLVFEPAVPWDSENTLGEEYANMVSGATLV